MVLGMSQMVLSRLLACKTTNIGQVDVKWVKSVVGIIVTVTIIRSLHSCYHCVEIGTSNHILYGIRSLYVCCLFARSVQDKDIDS